MVLTVLAPQPGEVLPAGPYVFRVRWDEPVPPANPPVASATWQVVTDPPAANPPTASATWEEV